MSKHKVNARKARKNLDRPLDHTQVGYEPMSLPRGVESGRRGRQEPKALPLPDLGEFRASIKLRGRPLSKDIREARASSRY